MIGMQQSRPPYVDFRQVAKHDPKRSLELGYRVTKDVDMAFIMQPGSKDCLEIEASAWLESIRRKSLEAAHDAYPEEWVRAFQQKFDAWKAGQEAPLNGTSVKEWPVLSPAQAQNFIALHLLTIEDVADMTEEAMQRYGMGSRELREKAREWIKGKEFAKTAINENETLKQQLAEALERIKALEEGEDKPRRTRKKAEPEAQ